tara:strand:+ start:8474 stop:8830 length:357 start_codon:yes stop_codon:yes gene_type:complete
MAYKVERVKVVIDCQDGVTKLGEAVPPYEIPLLLSEFGAEGIEVMDLTGGYFEVEDLTGEVDRLSQKYGEGVVRNVFGHSPLPAIQKAIEQVMEKQEATNGSKNTRKSKDRVSSAAGV